MGLLASLGSVGNDGEYTVTWHDYACRCDCMSSCLRLHIPTLGAFVAIVDLQHSPSSVVDSHAMSKLLQTWSWQRLGECVGEVVICRDVLQVECFILYECTDEVVAYVDVFGACVELVVRSKSYRTLVVAVDGDGMCDGLVELSDK